MDALIEKIEQAFSDLDYPGDDGLTDSTYGEEPAALKSEFQGKTDWQVLDSAFLDQAPDGWSSALSFFTDQALRFYLPAYLIADIRGELECVDPAIRLSATVTAAADHQRIAKMWGGSSVGERARAGFDLLDDTQAAIIVEYLQWKQEISEIDEISIQQALDHYWLKRLDQSPS